MVWSTDGPETARHWWALGSIGGGRADGRDKSVEWNLPVFHERIEGTSGREVRAKLWEGLEVSASSSSSSRLSGRRELGNGLALLDRCRRRRRPYSDAAIRPISCRAPEPTWNKPNRHHQCRTHTQTGKTLASKTMVHRRKFPGIPSSVSSTAIMGRHLRGHKGGPGRHRPDHAKGRKGEKCINMNGLGSPHTLRA